MGFRSRRLRMVSGQLRYPILLESEYPDALYPAGGVREPQLYLADADQLSLARAVELDCLSRAGPGESHPEFRAERLLILTLKGVKRVEICMLRYFKEFGSSVYSLYFFGPRTMLTKS